MDDTYREYIRGIGIDKECFFAVEEGTSTLQYQPTIMEKARKADWVVHPWTERPESEFFVQQSGNDNRLLLLRMLQHDRQESNSSSAIQPPPSVGGDTMKQPPSDGTASSSPFTTVMEELMFFKCKVGVHGIFSESVDTAVRAFNMNCPDTSAKGGSDGAAAGDDDASSSTPTPSSCPGNNSLINANNIPLAPLFLFSFFMGIFVTLLVWKLCCSKKRKSRPENDASNGVNGDDDVGDDGIMMTSPKISSRIQFGQKQHHSALSTDEGDHNHHELTLTAEDNEML
jgi:hypothetical protein